MWWLVALTCRYIDQNRAATGAQTAVRYVQALSEDVAAEAATDDLARLAPMGKHLQRMACVVVYSAQVREGLRELVDAWPV